PLPDRRVAAVDVAGVDHQQVLGRHLDHGQVAQRAVVGAVVEVRHGGQHVAHAAQAQLHVVADVAADVQAGVTADQVPTVFDVIGLGELDVAVVLAGGLQQGLGGLVVTLGRVVDLDDDLLVGDAFDDLPAARTDAVVTGNVIKTRTDASLGTGRTQLDLRIAQNQRVPVPEAAQVVHRVVHDGHPAVGFHALRDMAMVGKYDTDQQGQAGHDPQGDQELDKTGHSGVSGADSTACLRCEPRIVTGFCARAHTDPHLPHVLNGILTSASGANPCHARRQPCLTNAVHPAFFLAVPVRRGL